jgi:hypothetical protein
MLKMREKIARNLEDFFKIVSELGKNQNEQGESWLGFCGQASTQWKLYRGFTGANMGKLIRRR